MVAAPHDFNVRIHSRWWLSLKNLREAKSEIRPANVFIYIHLFKCACIKQNEHATALI